MLHVIIRIVLDFSQQGNLILMFRLSKCVLEAGRPLVRIHFRPYCHLPDRAPDKAPSSHQSNSIVPEKLHIKHDKVSTVDQDDDDDDDEEGGINGFLPDYDYRYVSQFEKIPNKDRNTFLEMIRVYEARDKQRRHDVEFIYVALKEMKEFGVECDLEVYKKIMNVMPKGKYEATNAILVEYMYYPKHQNCITFLLHQMEVNRK